MYAATKEPIDLLPCGNYEDLYQIPDEPLEIPSPCHGVKIEYLSESVLNVYVDDMSMWEREADAPDKNMFRLIGDFKRNGWTWNYKNGKNAFFKLKPGNSKTAKALFISRTASAAHQSYTTWDNAESDFFSWYKNSYNSFIKNDRNLATCPRHTELIDYILKFSDNGELKDTLIRISKGKTLEASISHDPKIVFKTSQDAHWTSFLLKAFSEAKYTLKIISPVISDESIFDELGKANARGVHLQVITPLKNNASFRSNPIFKEYKLPFPFSLTLTANS